MNDTNWQPIEPRALGWDAAALQDTLAFVAANNSDQLVIVEGGKLAVNASFGCTPDDSGDVYAVQKALFAVLLGIAQARGLLDIDDKLSQYLPAPWTRLPAAEEARLTVRHLLTMTTGMNHNLEPEGEIGRSWSYNNTAYNYLKRILIERTGMSLQALSEDWLLDRLGMTHTHWVDRDELLPDGRAVSGLTMSALDMARLGQLLLNEGHCDGEALLTTGYYRAMFTPGSAMNPAWCFLMSRNDQAQYMVPFRPQPIDGVPIQAAPADLLMSQGGGDNRLYVIPSAGRVIARRGTTAFPPEQHPSIDRPLWAQLSKIWEH